MRHTLTGIVLIAFAGCGATLNGGPGITPPAGLPGPVAPDPAARLWAFRDVDSGRSVTAAFLNDGFTHVLDGGWRAVTSGGGLFDDHGYSATLFYWTAADGTVHYLGFRGTLAAGLLAGTCNVDGEYFTCTLIAQN